MRLHAAIVAFNASVIVIALLIALVFTGIEGAELGVLVGIPMMFAVSLSEFVLCRKAEQSKERDAVLFELQQIYSGMKYSGKSLLSSMNDALTAMDRRACADVYNMLFLVHKKLLLGAQLDEAIASTCTGTGHACAALSDVGREYAKGREPTLAIKNAYNRLYNAIKLEDAGNAGKLQKYMTVSMALGTVLPSFAMFAFTGYSMVYYSPTLLSMFGVAMMVLMPNIFALVKAHAAGLYEV